MRISDWSSDVCSSDLQTVKQVRAQTLGAGFSRAGTAAHADNVGAGAPRIEHVGYQLGRVLQIRVQNNDGLARGLGQADRKSGGSGKSVSVSVDLGGCSTIKKTKKQNKRRQQKH